MKGVCIEGSRHDEEVERGGRRAKGLNFEQEIAEEVRIDGALVSLIEYDDRVGGEEGRGEGFT